MLMEARDAFNISLFLLSRVHHSKVNPMRWRGWQRDLEHQGSVCSWGRDPLGQKHPCFWLGGGEGWGE